MADARHDRAAGKLELTPAASWSEVMTALYDKHRALLPPDASAVQLAFQVRSLPACRAERARAERLPKPGCQLCGCVGASLQYALFYEQRQVLCQVESSRVPQFLSTR